MKSLKILTSGVLWFLALAALLLLGSVLFALLAAPLVDPDTHFQLGYHGILAALMVGFFKVLSATVDSWQAGVREWRETSKRATADQRNDEA